MHAQLNAMTLLFVIYKACLLIPKIISNLQYSEIPQHVFRTTRIIPVNDCTLRIIADVGHYGISVEFTSIIDIVIGKLITYASIYDTHETAIICIVRYRQDIFIISARQVFGHTLVVHKISPVG